MPSRPTTIGFVIGDPLHAAGVQPLVGELGRRGWSAHVLLCGESVHASHGGWSETGARIHVLDASRSPSTFRVPNLYEPSPTDPSDQIRHAVMHLHREHHFDWIEFGTRGGFGFRTIQAKRAGLGFDDVTLAVRFDGCGQQSREQAERWPSGLDELEVDFAERYSFEVADAQVLPSPEWAEHVQRLGWTVRGHAPGYSPGVIAPPAVGPDHGLADEYERFIRCCSESVSLPTGGGRSPPLVSIGVTHYNLGRFLPDALHSVASQTYPNVEVIVVDDGSTDAESIQALEDARRRYPHFRFHCQPNSGAASARNRCLAEARGEYFIPVDADNIARPDMVETFVRGISRNPHLSAMTCYFLAFRDTDREATREYLFACRPTGGPHTMASLRNVYGDTTAILRTDDFRAMGGYEPDRGTSTEDWEAFVKLVHAGKRIGVIPDHLFEYRHRSASFSRTTNRFANHQRVLRQFTHQDHLPPGEAAVLWSALLGFQQQVEQLTSRQECLRYRLADRVHALCSRVPGALRLVKRVVRSAQVRMARR